MDKTNSNMWKIYILAFVSFLVGTLQFVFGGILDKVAVSVGVPISAAGQLITAFSLGSAIGTPVIIMLAAKMERRRLLLLAFSVVLLSTISTIVLPGFGFLMFSRVLLGVGFGVYGICAFTIVAKLAPEGRKARSLSNLSIGSSIALVIGIPAARMVTASYNWKVIFWVIGGLLLLVIFVLTRTVPVTEGEAPIPLRNQLALLKKPKISIALCVTFFMFISYSSVNTYLAPYLTSVMKISEEGISIILFALGIASVVGAKLGGFLADHIGAGRTLFWGMVVQAIFLILMSILPKSTFVTIPLLMIWSIAAWTSGPILMVNLVSIAPEAPGIMLSLNSTFVQLGFAAGAGIGGIAVNGSSITSIGWIGAVSVVLATLMVVLSFERATTGHKDKHKTD